MNQDTKCPKCGGENTYQDGSLWTCPECFHEFDPNAPKAATDDVPTSDVVRDAHGNELKTGDTVTVIKDLKIKGSSSVVKAGTKVKNIRVSDQGDGHDIACKIDGLGAINLKSEFVKKV